MDDIASKAVQYHKTNRGKIAITSVVPVDNKDDLSLAYTPGVAAVSKEIAAHPDKAYDLTWRGRSVAVISDGSAVLGLGNIGPLAALPVMEGKALLLKQYGGVDAVPIVINTQDPSGIIEFVKQISPSFAGINLEDISAPRCFQVEEALQDIGIPVFHDDQHGTAIVVRAALHNAARVVGKRYEDLHVVIVGAGAAGLAIAKMLLGMNCNAESCSRIAHAESIKDLIIVDKHGAIYAGREDQNVYKQAIAAVSNTGKRRGSLLDIIEGADAIIGVSGPNTISSERVRRMNKDAIVFALANPTPEIMPDLAIEAGAAIVATGRSDLPNQINNVLAFPGVFRAVINGKLKQITQEMKLAASDALIELTPNPTNSHIIPDAFTPHLAEQVASAILKHVSAGNTKMM